MTTPTYPDAPSILREIEPAIRERGVEAFAVAAGVSAPAMWKWLGGSRVPSLANLCRVADAAGYDLKVTLKRRARAKPPA